MREHINDTRGMIQEGIVTGVDDSGGTQTVTVRTADGFVYADVEVIQAAGMASVPPADGAIVALLAIGGDVANMRALPVANPKARMGKLKPGEAALYGAGGSRVHIRQSGVVEVKGAAHVLVSGSAATVTVDAGVAIVAPGGCHITGNGTITGDLGITGNLTVGGNISAAGDVSDGAGALARLRGNYNGHHHGGGTGTDRPD